MSDDYREANKNFKSSKFVPPTTSTGETNPEKCRIKEEDVETEKSLE